MASAGEKRTGKGETNMQSTYPVTVPRKPVALGTIDARSIFISRTYADLMGAIPAAGADPLARS